MPPRVTCPPCARNGARLCQSGDGVGAGWRQMKKPERLMRQLYPAPRNPKVEDAKNDSMRSIPLKEDFNGDGPVASYLNNRQQKETTMKLTTIALASAFALSST